MPQKAFPYRIICDCFECSFERAVFSFDPHFCESLTQFQGALLITRYVSASLTLGVKG